MDAASPQPDALDAEAEVVLALCRPHAGDIEFARVEPLLQRSLDWGQVIDHAVRHRVFPTVWANLRRMDRGPGVLYDHLAESVRLYNATRWSAFAGEFRAIRSALDANALDFLPRKGAVLAELVYPDPALRFMADIDLLVHREDGAALRAALAGLGYHQGALSNDHRTVEPITREVEAFWLLNTSSFPQYFRPTGQPGVGSFCVDLRHHVLEPRMSGAVPMSDWFARARPRRLLGAETVMMTAEDFFLDLCVHLYREAMTLTTIETNRDMRLYKFVDISATLASAALRPDLDTTAARAEQYGLADEVYYALRHTETMLPNSVPHLLLDRLRPDDDAYLDEYGSVDGQRGTWTQPVRMRAFDYNRRNTTIAQSKLLRSTEQHRSIR